MNAPIRRTNDPTGLRNRVLDTAAALFQAHGYAGTAISDVVGAAGVTSGALHHHFSTKKELALAVVDERVSREIATTWVDAMAGASCAATGIVAVFERVAEALAEQGSVAGCPLGNLASELSLADLDLRSALRREYAAWETSLLEALRRDRAIGRAAFATDSLEGFATATIALFSGALMLGKVQQAPDALLRCVRVLRGVMADDLG